MSRRAIAIVAALFGLATLASTIAFAFLPDVAAIYAPEEVSPIVSEFQRAASQDDLDDIFGSPPNSAVVDAMNAINRLDLFGHIPVYTVFLIAAALLLGGGARPWAWAMIAPALVGAGADVVETVNQLRLTTDWPQTEAILPLIAPAHWLKYGALAVNAALVAAFCLTSAPRRWWLGVAALAPLPCTLLVWLGIVHDPRLFAAAFALFWVMLLLVSVREVLRRESHAGAGAGARA